MSSGSVPDQEENCPFTMSGYELRQYQIPLNYETSEEDLPEATALVSYPTNVPISTTPSLAPSAPSQFEYRSSSLSRPASLRSLRETQHVPLIHLPHARNVRSQTDFEPTKQFICNGTQTEFVVSPGVLEKLHTSVDILKSEIVTLVTQQGKREQTSTETIKSQLDTIKRELNKINAAKVRFSDQNSRQVYYKPSSIVTCKILSPIYLLCLTILIFQAIILGVIFRKFRL